MKIDDIMALAEILKKYDLSAVELTEGETKIKVKRQIQISAPMPVMSGVASAVAYPNAEPSSAPAPAAALDDADTMQVNSPMVGVFYAAPSPDSEPFVSLGKQVNKGDVLCIVEAMKLMNEIIAEADGEIVDICVANGQVVEFGQELFKLRRGNHE